MIQSLFPSISDETAFVAYFLYVLRTKNLFCFKRYSIACLPRLEHLLTEAPLPGPAASLIVVKGLLTQGGACSIGDTGGGAGQRVPGEWLLVVSRVEGTIQRFVARGVDLIEPGTGLWSLSLCECAL